MKPLRILIVNRMAAVERGGGETFDLEMGHQLAALGHEVSFLCGWPLFARLRARGARPCNKGADDAIPWQAVDHMILLRSPFFRWFPWDKVRGGWRLRMAEFWIFEKLAARWIDRHRPPFDIIQICELPTLVKELKRKRKTGKQKTKTVLRLTAPNVHDPAGGVQMADAVIASGTSIQKIRATLRPDCFDIPNGVDVERFRPASVVGHPSSVVSKPEIGNLQPATRIRNPEHNQGPRTKNQEPRTKNQEPAAPAPLALLYVARFQAFKNHALLVQALRRVVDVEPGVTLQLAGSGPLRRETEELATKLGIMDHVKFLGEVPYEELPQVYQQADVMAISSEYESFCFAAIEAMASGLPVVTTDCGWVPRLIGDELPPIDKQYVDARPEPEGRFASSEEGQRWRAVPGGLVTDRIDVASLEQALLRMIRDPVLRQQCSDWNRARAVREHGWASSAERLVDVYQNLLAERENT
jgi:glycosyltransferase involved in cell wall biosynthesis